MKRFDIDELSAAFVNAEPVLVLWCQYDIGTDYNWVEFFCCECGNNATQENGQCSACGRVCSEGPLTNFLYEVKQDDVICLAERLADLPVCVVKFEDETKFGFAITGIGEPIEWSICKAYVRLGYMPPYCFARDLRPIEGRPRSEEDRFMIEACRASIAWVQEGARLSAQWFDAAFK